MARVTNTRARAAARKPQSFRGHPVVYGEVVVFYDDEVGAESLAVELGTYAKHARNKHESEHWTMFSIVKLPKGWEEMARMELEHIA